MRKLVDCNSKNKETRIPLHKAAIHADVSIFIRLVKRVIDFDGTQDANFGSIELSESTKLIRLSSTVVQANTGESLS